MTSTPPDDSNKETPNSQDSQEAQKSQQPTQEQQPAAAQKAEPKESEPKAKQLANESAYGLAEAGANSEAAQLPPVEPTDAQIVDTKEEKEAWWQRLLAFLGASSSAIIGLGVIALSGYYLWVSIVKDLPKIENEAWAEWIAFAGRFHVLVLHLPIGGVAYLLFLEFCRRFQLLQSRKRKLSRVPVLLFIAITAVFAAALGYFLGLSGYKVESEYFRGHLNAGIFFTLCTGFALFFGALLAQWNHFISRVGYLFSLVLVNYAVVVAGHGGGNLVRGKDYLFEKAPEMIRKPLENLGIDFPEAIVPPVIDLSAAASIPLEEREIYTQVIAPVLQVHCVKCHGADKSYGSRMDSYELLLKGGGFGPGVVAGDPDNSMIIKRMELPEGHGEHMPPVDPKNIQPSKETVLLLREWIAAGAPQTGKLGDFSFSEEALSAVPKLDSSGQAAPVEPELSQEEKDKQAAEDFAKQQLFLREELVPIVEELGAKLGTSSLLFTSRETPQLSFNGFSLGTGLDAEMLSSLAPISSELIEINLRATSLDDEMAAALPESLPKLINLDVAQTQITEKGLNEIIQRAPLLQRLVAYESAVGDGVFEALSQRSDLQFVSLKSTQVTPVAAAQFQAMKPEVEVLFEPLEPDPEAAAIKQRELEEYERSKANKR